MKSKKNKKKLTKQNRKYKTKKITTKNYNGGSLKGLIRRLTRRISYNLLPNLKKETYKETYNDPGITNNNQNKIYIYQAKEKINNNFFHLFKSNYSDIDSDIDLDFLKSYYNIDLSTEDKKEYLIFLNKHLSNLKNLEEILGYLEIRNNELDKLDFNDLYKLDFNKKKSLIQKKISYLSKFLKIEPFRDTDRYLLLLLEILAIIKIIKIQTEDPKKGVSSLSNNNKSIYADELIPLLKIYIEMVRQKSEQNKIIIPAPVENPPIVNRATKQHIISAINPQVNPNALAANTNALAAANPNALAANPNALAAANPNASVV